MSKFVANKIYLTPLPEGKLAVSFIADDRYVANMFVKELENHDKIEVSAKPHKESRSIRQNNMLWSIITKISDYINNEHSEESMMKIYAELLVKANTKRELMAIVPESLETLKTMFRAVIPTGQTIETINKKTGKKNELISVWCYIGSSKMNTKEMSELIDHALLYASEIGIVDSEIETIRREYYLNEK